MLTIRTTLGFDRVANAGAPGHWNGIIIDREGNPLI
jgi:phage shock protein PspC (stress-responsive transcriptional regulator)